MNKLTKQMEARFLTERAMEEISKGTKKVLMDYIHEGYLRTFANVILYLGKDTEEAKELLMELSENKRNQVLLMVDNCNSENIQVIKDVEHILDSVKMTFDTEYDVIRENIYNSGTEIKNVIQNFRKEVPIFQEKLSHCLFDFENIIHLDDRAIQKLLRELDLQELATALKGSSPDVQDCIFHNLSNRAATMLKEDMEFMGPVKVSRVTEMQNKIIQIIMRLESTGDIVIPMVSDEPVIE